MGVELYVSGVNGDKKVDTATINEPWGPTCSNGGGGGNDGRCDSLTVNGDGKYTTSNGDKWDTYAYVRVTDSGGHTLVQGDGSDYSEVGPAPASKSWTYTPKGEYVYIHVIRKYKHLNGTDWVYTTYYDNAYQNDDPSSTYQGVPQTACYAASCTISIPSDVPGATTGGQEIGGSSVTATVTITNLAGTASYPYALALPGSVDGHPFVFSSDGGNQINGFSGSPPDTPIGPGETDSFPVTMSFPGGINNYTVSGTPNYSGGFNTVPGGCTSSVAVYNHFNINPYVAIAAGTNPENPYEAGTNTHGITYTVGGDLTEGPTITANTSSQLQKNGVTVDSHSTNDNYGSVRNTYNYADSSFIAGDQYCPYVTIWPANGYRGPSGDIGDQSASLNGNCITVMNEPYFKARGSGGIAASTGLYSPSNVCPAKVNGSGQPINSGLLAGWNDNALPGGVDRGSGSELSDLALIQITGVASAQTDISRSATDLSFANNGSPAGSISAGVDSPLLGGNLGGGGGCTAVPAIAATQTLPRGSVGSPTPLPTDGGTFQTAGNLYLGGGTVSGTKPTAIHVNGNVYLSAPIVYGANPSWTDTNGTYTGPSFTIVATGNIYISNNVTELDGVYYAQPTDGGSGGTIYDCATGLSALSPSYDFYHNCNNQLLVYGSFVSDNLKMLRTFGSLRDEEPAAGVAGVDVVKNGSSYTSCTDTELDAPGVACSVDGSSVFNWENYSATYKFRSPARSDYKLKINFDNYTNPGAPNWPPNPATGYHYVIKVRVSGGGLFRRGVTYTQNVTPVAGSGSFEVNLGSVPANPRITISGYNNYWIAYGGNPDAYDPNFEINSLELKAGGTPITPPASPTCSGYPGLRSGISPASTCAAELFVYSPERYLQLPATEQSGGGAIQYDAVTSLPPVL